MDGLPGPIAEFLHTSLRVDRSPAYLRVSADGLLADWGGRVDVYGLTGLERGRSAAEQVVALQGLLPAAGCEICLPCVRMGSGAPADLYLLRDADCAWVLLLDASAFDLRLQTVQQAAHERSLHDESRHLLPAVFRALDLVVLEYVPDRPLLIISDAPPWLRLPLPGASRFIENFMVDAESLWRLGNEGSTVRSGPWHEDGLMPEGELWDVTALRLHGRNLVVLSRSLPSAAERQHLLQAGRERSLELTASLAALETKTAEHRRTAVRNRLLARAVESTHEMICVTDLDDRFTFVNRAFLETYGYAEDELIGQHVSMIVSAAESGDVIPQVLGSTRADGFVGELINRRKDGSTFPILLSTSQIRDDHGQLIGLLGVSRDISDRKAAEAALRDVEGRLRQAQKMEAVGRLAGGVAHDFNNLLTVMTGYTEIALAHLDPAEAVYADIDQVKQACERATALTRQLLAFSRRQILTPHVLDLNGVVAQLGTMLRRLIGEDIHLTLTPAPAPALTKADAGQLEQVIMNLVVNSRDAMPRGGSLAIEVSSAHVADDRAARLGVAPGRYVMLAVRDTGVGMDEATLSRIFEPFFTTKPSGQGTGLGLATTYGILRQSGGGIDVVSAPGQGACFTVCLPSLESTPSPEGPDDSPAPGSRGSGVVLLVEDDDAVRILVAIVLRNLGYDVVEAATGEEAIQLATRRATAIDLMLSDTVMPGIGGRELAERMTALHPEVKVILMSGYTDDTVLRRQIRDRHVAFLQKPFTADALARLVHEVVTSDQRTAPPE